MTAKYIDPLLVRRLPDDVIINHILPYTYMTQPIHLIEDIRSFTTDYNLVESVYMTQFNELILLNDLLMFLFINIKPIYGVNNMFGINDIFENLLRRHFYMKNKSDVYLITQIRVNFHRNVGVNTERKIKVIWGLMDQVERANFINMCILG